jgi:hypothetical protein
MLAESPTKPFSVYLTALFKDVLQLEDAEAHKVRRRAIRAYAEAAKR